MLYNISVKEYENLCWVSVTFWKAVASYVIRIYKCKIVNRFLTVAVMVL